MPQLPNEPSSERPIGQLPDAAGRFGEVGGCFVAETLMGPIAELQAAYERYREDAEFKAEFAAELKHFVGRPSPLYFAQR